MITKQEVRTFRVDMQCPKCKDGILMATGNSFTAGSTSVEHRCSNPECSKRTTVVNQHFPKFTYESIGEPIILEP